MIREHDCTVLASQVRAVASGDLHHVRPLGGG